MSFSFVLARTVKTKHEKARKAITSRVLCDTREMNYERGYEFSALAM